MGASTRDKLGHRPRYGLGPRQPVASFAGRERRAGGQLGTPNAPLVTGYVAALASERAHFFAGGVGSARRAWRLGPPACERSGSAEPHAVRCETGRACCHCSV
jgi:hypothetical protein